MMVCTRHFFLRSSNNQLFLHFITIFTPTAALSIFSLSPSPRESIEMARLAARGTSFKLGSPPPKFSKSSFLYLSDLLYSRSWTTTRKVQRWTLESLDILTRYEKLKLKAFQTANGNHWKEKIVKKWY
jgi:hypothetical protein